MADFETHDGPRAQFRAMTEGTQEDWSIIAGHFRGFASSPIACKPPRVPTATAAGKPTS
jgi:hypothetical protein